VHERCTTHDIIDWSDDASIRAAITTFEMDAIRPHIIEQVRENEYRIWNGCKPSAYAPIIPVLDVHGGVGVVLCCPLYCAVLPSPLWVLPSLFVPLPSLLRCVGLGFQDAAEFPFIYYLDFLRVKPHAYEGRDFHSAAAVGR
jgi:hypothetical protein